MCKAGLMCNWAFMCKALGWIEKIEHNLRGNPPPGVIWYRKAYDFNTGQRHDESRGRQLTRKELQQITKERREAKRKKSD